MAAKLSAFVIWALLAACAAFWALRLVARPAQVPPQALPVALEQALKGDMSRLFPARPLPQAAALAPASSRFQVLGVVAPKAHPQSAEGVALIAVDGQPPRPYRVGARVEADLVVQSISQHTVQLGPKDGPAAFSLDLPALPPPATGQLPPADLPHAP